MSLKTKKLLHWKPLVPGALVDVIAPASRGPQEELEAGIKVLESWGLRVRIPKPMFGESLFHSNSDEERWLQLKRALTAKDSLAVWCVRGGYGSMKLLPPLSRLKPPLKSKIFIGLSDITSLNIFLNQKWNWPVLHAPILTRVGKGDLPPASIEELKQILFGYKKEIQFELTPINAQAQRLKSLQAPIYGGNWVTLMAGAATLFQIKTKNSILFLEDAGERGYRLDRLWEQCLQMGLFKEIKALILGDFTLGDEPDGKNYVWEALKRRAQELKKPVFCGLPAGHGLIQRPLPLGPHLKIKRVDMKKASLSIKESFLATMTTGVL